MTRLAHKKILVVDDEEDLRGAIAFELEMEGAEVLQASGGHEAIEVIKSENPCLVISDIRMPKGDGVELIANIKKCDPFMPTVLLITGFADFTIEQAYDHGASGFISKPFDPEFFIKLVERSLKNPKEFWAEELPGVPTNLEVKIESNSFSEAASARILNIGRGGMFIAAQAPLPKIGTGIKFQIIFKEPSLFDLEGFGVVRWVREKSTEQLVSGYGVEFFGLKPEMVRRLDVLVKNLFDKVPFIPAM